MSNNPPVVLIGSRTLIESGNSTMVTIPPGILEDMDVADADEVTMLYDRSESEVILQAEDESGGRQ